MPDGDADPLPPLREQTIFIDRSLGAAIVPAALREAGFQIVTMREHYGEAAGAGAADVEWITDASARGWVLFCKDAAIRRNVTEREAVRAAGGRMFCMANGNVTGSEMARRFLRSAPAIERIARRPGPYIYGVEESRLTKVL